MRPESRNPREARRAATIIAVALLATAAFARATIAADLKPYKVGYNNWIGYVALFVARDKGFFKEEGLDVQTKMFSSPGDGLAPLLSGDLDAHLTTADSVIIALDKAPGKWNVKSLRQMIVGGSAVPQALIEAFDGGALEHLGFAGGRPWPPPPRCTRPRTPSRRSPKRLGRRRGFCTILVRPLRLSLVA